jgi:hypothetical protein
MADKVNQQLYFLKAINTVRSCQNASQIAMAEAVVNQYDEMEAAFLDQDEEYDHEWHIYTLMAELSTAKKLLS